MIHKAVRDPIVSAVRRSPTSAHSHGSVYPTARYHVLAYHNLFVIYFIIFGARLYLPRLL